MFQKYLERILKDTIGEFIQQIDANALSVGVWSGKIEINNVKIKKNILRRFKLPIAIKHSFIQGLSIIIPWKNLFGSPLVVSVDSITVLCSFAQENLSLEETAHNMINMLDSTIKALAKQLIERSKLDKEKQKNGYIDQFLSRMFDNLVLNLNNIHLRFEQETKLQSYSFGISLQSIKVYAVDRNGDKVFIDRNKLQANNAILRKKIEMNNLAIYCNYNEKTFMCKLPTTAQITAAMLKTIYKKASFDSLKNSNNYVLIMNIIGSLTEDHRAEPATYFVDLNFEKLMIKLEKAVINQVLLFGQKISKINQQLVKATVKRTIQTNEEILLRKYCQAFLKEFKNKEQWNAKDEQAFKSSIVQLYEQQLVQKIKNIIINQIGIAELAKSLALKSDQLNRALIQINKQLSKQPALFEYHLMIPQISLYLVNELSESILQVKIMQIKLTHRTIVNTNINNKLTQTSLSIQELQAISGYDIKIIWTQSQSKADLLNCVVTTKQKQPIEREIVLRLAPVTLLYDFQTINKMLNLMHFQDIDGRFKNKALDKMEELESRVNTKIVAPDRNLRLTLQVQQPKILFRQANNDWIVQQQSIALSYNSLTNEASLALNSIQVILRAITNSITVIKPFQMKLHLCLSSELDSLQLIIDNLQIELNSSITTSLHKLNLSLFQTKKTQTLSQANKSGTVFLKQNRWKKCLATLTGSHLHIWQNESENPLVSIRIRFVRRITRGKIDIIEVSDKKRLYELSFKQQQQMMEWQNEFDKLIKVLGEDQHSTTASSIKQMKVKLQIGIVRIMIMPLDDSILQSVVCNVGNIGINYQQYISSNVVNVNIQSISLHDGSEQLIIKDDKTVSILSIESNIFGHCEDTEVIGNVVTVQIAELTLVYKPKVVVMIIAVLSTSHDEDKSYEKNYQERLQLQNNQKILSQITISMGKFRVICHNKISKLQFIQIVCESGTFCLSVKYYQIILKGTIDDIKIVDLTNYPNTIYQQSQLSQLQPKTIIGNNGNPNEISITLQFLFIGSQKLQGRRSKLGQVQFNNLRLNYIHQVIKRIIDYINVQILGLAMYPQFFSDISNSTQKINSAQELDFSCYTKQKQQRIITKYMNKLGKAKVKQQLENEYPLFFTLAFKNSILHIVSSSFDEGIEFTIRSIVIHNDFQFQKQQTKLSQLTIPFDYYYITMSEIDIRSVEQGVRQAISQGQHISINFIIKYFGRQLQLAFIHSVQQLINCQIGVTINVSSFGLDLNENSLITLRKAVNLNIMHEDGLDFLMIYDYMLVSSQSQINLRFTSDVFICQLQLQQYKDIIALQMGHFCYGYQRKHNCKQTNISNSYILINYSRDGHHFNEVLTSRKVFGRGSNRGSLLDQLKKESRFKEEDVVWKYQSRTMQGRENVSIDAKELMIITNMDCLLFCYRIVMSQEKIVPYYQQFLKLQKDQKTKVIQPSIPLQTKYTHFKLQKILICQKVPENDVIISILLTAEGKILEQSTQAFLSDLQAFISNEEQITCEFIDKMKKRTLLRPTHLKVELKEDKYQIAIGKCFFKISLNDIKGIILSVNSIRKKLQQLTKLQKQLDNRSSQFRTSSNKLPSSKSLKINPTQSPISYRLIPQQSKSPPSSPPPLILSDPHIYSISIDTIQIMIVNDLSEFLTPVIYSNLKIYFSSTKSLQVQLFIDCFNLRNSVWEPLLEKNKLIVNIQPHLSIRLINDKQCLNINMSSNFIENIIKTLNHRQLKNSKLIYAPFKVDRDQINSWIIINQLGEDILCESVDSQQRTIFVKNGESKTIPFLSFEGQKQFKQKQIDQIMIKITIGKKLIIKKLNLNQMGLKRITTLNNYLQNEGEKGIIVKNLFVDISKNVKYVTLSSAIILENRSSISLKFQLMNDKRQLYILPNSQIPLPFDCTLQSIIYYPTQSNDISSKLCDIQDHTSMIIRGKTFNIVISNKKLRKHYSLMPMCKIENYLPFPIIINFKKNDQNCLYTSLELSSRDSTDNYGYLYHQLQDLQFSILIEDYQCMQFIKLSSDVVQIKDFQNNMLSLRCQKYRENQAIINIAIMARNILTNRTKDQFEVIINNRTHKLSIGKSFICERNSLVLCLKGQQSSELFLGKTSLQLSLRNSPYDIFKSQLQFILSRNLVQLFPRSSSSPKLAYTSYDILPMYNLQNNFSTPLLLKQTDTKIGQHMLIPPGKDINIVWYLSKTERRLPPFFRVALQDSTYDWSNLLNLQQAGQIHFVMRNRNHFLDVKYCLVQIVKFSQAYRITFEELLEDRMPFIVSNKMEHFRVYVDDYKVVLQPGQETYFSWDDPLVNHKYITVELRRIGDGLQFKRSKNAIKYKIKVDSYEQDNIQGNIEDNLQMQTLHRLNKKIFQFTDRPKIVSQYLALRFQLCLPVRMALINNSFSPVNHLLDLTTLIKMQYEDLKARKQACIEFNNIQLDNQTKYLSYFPVVLTTDLKVQIRQGKSLQVQVHSERVRLSIQQDFIQDFYLFLSTIRMVMDQHSAIPESPQLEDTLFISKIILPKLIIDLEIQTKKFSIETTINLDKPEVTNYPWTVFPYPVRTIMINILSHLSISPWAFISSFSKGVSLLLTEQETSKGFEGFFQQLIGGVSNSINGMVGVIVGHDIEKIDNFIDGLNKGVWVLGTSLAQIAPTFDGNYSPWNICKGLGTSLVNIAFKPITGVLRMTLKISQGIKKTAKFSFGQNQKQFKHRLPIVFYNRQQCFKTYNLEDSELMISLKKCVGLQLKYFYVVEFIKIEYKINNDSVVLAIGAQAIILFNARKQKIIWQIEIQHISDIQIQNLCTIVFHIDYNSRSSREKSSKTQHRRYQLDASDEKLVTKIIQDVRKIKKTSYFQI